MKNKISYLERERGVSWKKDFKNNKLLYVMFLIPGAYFIVMNYVPMYGILIAFKDYKIAKGIMGSKWVGLENFIDLFTGASFLTALRNTAAMALMNLTIGFVMPIVFAFLITEIRHKKFKRTLQTISYMPHFIAAVVVVQLVKQFIGSDGAITLFLSHFGFERQNWLTNANIPVFWIINTFTDVWQNIGFGSILYVASIAMVSSDFHEAAVIDGASRWQRIFKITLPNIMPTVIMLFTLRIGLVFVVGFDKVLLMYSPPIYDTADVLFTYTYRMAFGSTINYGLSTASGLFQSVIGTLLLVVSNYMSRRIGSGNNSLF